MATTTAGLRNLFAFLVFAFVASVTLLHHELWRDELQAYGIARNSHSLMELMANKAYEGHPVIWYYLLYGLTRLTSSPFAMQLMHLLIGLIGIVIFLRYFPGNAWIKILLPLGYFFIYEYTVISRNYGLGFALSFGLMAAIQCRQWWLSALLLCMLMHTSVYGFLLASAILPLLLYKQQLQDKRIAIITAILFSFSATLFWITVRPPDDSGFSPGWAFHWMDLQRAINTIWDVFIPLPKAQLNTWNSNIISDELPWIKTSLSLLIFTGAIISLRKSKQALIFFLFSMLLILLFLTCKYLGFVRHQGHLFLAYILALWLANLNQDNAPSKGFSFTNIFTGSILTAQVLSGLIACYMDWQYPFSNAEKVAAYINYNYPRASIASSPDYIGTPVAVLLNRTLYYPASERSGQFIIWDSKRQSLSEDLAISLAGRKRPPGTKLLLLSGSLLQQTDSLKAYGFYLLDSFPPTIVKNEQYFIYR